MEAKVNIVRGRPTPEQALRLVAEVFPAPGEYVVKAASGAAAAEEDFEEWFLDRLHKATIDRAMTLREAIWDVLDRLFAERGYQAASQADFFELASLLTDASYASTARMVGLRIPEQVTARLTAYGFHAPETLDFPGLAYRMGLIYDALTRQGPTSWEELTARAAAVPLSPAEQSAVVLARNRAGIYMRPIFDAAGQVWTADRELPVVRAAVARAIETRQSRREAARELGNTQRAEGIVRDARRVARTEIARATNEASFAHLAARGVDSGDLMYRQTSRYACKTCLRLFKTADGMPRLYTRAEIEAADAEGPNRGPASEWKVKVGPVHPNCVCPPWGKWHPALETLARKNAGYYVDLLTRLGVEAAPGEL